MIMNFTALADTLYALATLTALAILVAIGMVAAAALTKRDKAKHADQGPPPAPPTSAQAPAQLYRRREPVSR